MSKKLTKTQQNIMKQIELTGEFTTDTRKVRTMKAIDGLKVAGLIAGGCTNGVCQTYVSSQPTIFIRDIYQDSEYEYRVLYDLDTIHCAGVRLWTPLTGVALLNYMSHRAIDQVLEYTGTLAVTRFMTTEIQK